MLGPAPPTSIPRTTVRLPHLPDRTQLNRSHPAPAPVLCAVMLALLSVVSGVPTADAATGTRTSAQNLSNNPRLARSAAGYSIQEGGKWFKRIRVDHVVAS